MLMRVTSPDIGISNMETSDASRVVAPASSPNSRPLDSLPLVTLNDVLWLLYLYPIRLLAAVVPRWLLYLLGKLSDPIVQFESRRAKARAALWIARACRTSPENARRIAGQSLSNTMFRTLDGLLLLRPSFDKMLRCTGIHGIQHLDSAIARGKGVILLSGHFCANRIALRYLAAQGYPALSVHGAAPSNKAAGQLGRQFLQPRSTQLQKRALPDQVLIHDPDCSLKILRRLRAGGLVLLQIDARAKNGTEQVFLGVPRPLRTGVCEIVRLSDCAVVPILHVGRSNGFRIRFDPMLEIFRAPSREAFVSANLPRFVSVVERQVLENPGEWRLWNNQ